MRKLGRKTIDLADLIEVDQDGQAMRVCFLTESLSSREELDEIFQELARLAASRPQPRLILNFRFVNNLSSVFIGKLLALMKRLQNLEGKVELTEVNDQVFEIFVLTRIREYIPVQKSAVPSRTGGKRRPRLPSTPLDAWLTLVGITLAAAVGGVMALHRIVATAGPDAVMPGTPQLAAIACFAAAIPGLAIVWLYRFEFRDMDHILQWIVTVAVLAAVVISAMTFNPLSA